MSFFGKVKQATGIGLDGEASYRRAFEKGVLTGDQRGAVGMFREAAAKLEKEGNGELAARAEANALLYQLLSGAGPGVLPPLCEALGRIDRIEQVGSQSEFMETQPLIDELQVRIAEAQIDGASYRAAIEGHRRAMAALQKILDRQLLTYALVQLPGDGFAGDTAVARYSWHQGMSSYLQALLTMGTSPGEAASQASAAAQAFQRCGDREDEAKAEQLARNLLIRRTCWLCHREMQGLGTYVRWYASAVAPYTLQVLDRAGQDQGTVDVAHNQVILCAPCGAIVERQAERYASERANAVRAELQVEIDGLRRQVAALEQRLRNR